MDVQELTGLKVKALAASIKGMGVKDQEFAKSLVNGWEKYHRLSDKQLYWVEKLIIRVERLNDPETAAIEVGAFDGVLKLFKTAAEHLKYPKITLQTTDAQVVQLSVAGKSAKAPGTVNVTDGKPFGVNLWYGRVHPDGKWERGHKVTDEQAKEVQSLLTELSADPAGTAGKYGKLVGRCCFCNSNLTDEHSTGAGFGPVCAKNYGLSAQWKAANTNLAQMSLGC